MNTSNFEKRTRRSFLTTSLGCAGALATTPRKTCSATEESPVSIGSERQLFVDDQLVDVPLTRGATRTLNPPREIRRVLKPERPWESLGFIFYSSVLEDETGIKLYYGSYSWDAKLERHTCLATSQDGTHFQRPALANATLEGKTVETNCFSPKAIEAAVFLDPHSPPEKRYRLLTNGGGMDDPKKGGIYTSTSLDGIRWERNPVRLLPFMPDSQHTVYWDEKRRKYVIYTRAWDRVLRNREVCRIEVDDIDKPWPYDASVPPYLVWGKDKTPTLSRQFPIVMARDDQDPENADVYTNTVTPYPFASGYLFAFPALYKKYKGPKWEGVALGHNDGSFTVQLGTSRDGVSWHRWREPYIAPGVYDGVQLALVSMARGMVRRGEWIYQYFVGWPHTHGRPDVWNHDPANREEWIKKEEKGGIFLAKQRLDGFVSMDSGREEGVLTTKLLMFEGRSFSVNAETRANGILEVSLLDASGNPIPGFADGYCEAARAGEVSRTVSWKGASDLGRLAGRVIRVQVRMREAKVYALQFGA